MKTIMNFINQTTQTVFVSIHIIIKLQVANIKLCVLFITAIFNVQV